MFYKDYFIVGIKSVDHNVLIVNVNKLETFRQSQKKVISVMKGRIFQIEFNIRHIS